eukprot:828015-Prymnesium_polylepis.1
MGVCYGSTGRGTRTGHACVVSHPRALAFRARLSSVRRSHTHRCGMFAQHTHTPYTHPHARGVAGGCA